jgi:hypothetical protein
MRRKTEDYFLPIPGPTALLSEPPVLSAVARQVAERVFRTDLSRPGFALLDLGSGVEPRSFRQALVALADELSAWCREAFGVPLAYLSLGCFDQQATTRPHRDGAPDESVLVLGYEPTAVASRLFLLDYSAAARDRGMAPREFLRQRGLACTGCEEILAEYTTEVSGWHPAHYQVLVINNGAAADGSRGMLGVLHQAQVTRDPAQSRRVNSLTLVMAGTGATVLTPYQVQAFVETASAAG